MGGVPVGRANDTVVPPVPALGLLAQDFFVISGIWGDNASLLITVRATMGATAIGVDAGGNPLRDPLTQQPLVHNATLQLRTNGDAVGTWMTSLLGGSGTMTVTSVSQTAAAGSFTFTMVPAGRDARFREQTGGWAVQRAGLTSGGRTA